MPSRTFSRTDPLRALPLRLVVPAILASAAGALGAADLREVTVEKEDGRYRLRSETWFDATPGALYRVLSDYELHTQFTSAITESRNLEPGSDGRPRYYTKMQGCILLFCKSFVRIGSLKLTPEVEIVATADPSLSDVHYSREHWHLRAEGRGTQLVYEFELEPEFWVPPVIGPYLVKRVLKAGGEDAVQRIEALAQGRKPRP